MAQCLHGDGGDGGSDASGRESAEIQAVEGQAAVPVQPACTLSVSDSGRGVQMKGHCKESAEGSMTATWALQHHHSHQMNLS